MTTITNFKSYILFAAALCLIQPVWAGESGTAQKTSPRETLKQYVAELQQSPDDQELRGKIIKLVATMKPKPAIPEEIIELKGQATAAFKQAKAPAEYVDAVDAYQKALLLAPWVGDIYFNLGVAQQKAEKSLDAIQSFKLYLLASPNAPDREAVLERIGGLKFTAEKSSRESSVASEQQAYDVWLRDLDGARFRWDNKNGYQVFVITGNMVGVRCYNRNIRDEEMGCNISGTTRFTIKGREFILPKASWRDNDFRDDEVATISEDGTSISYAFYRFTDGQREARVYRRGK